MVADFSSKLNFEAKEIKFVEKTYRLKTDHKTGLLMQELYKKKDEAGIEDKILKLVYGEKQYDELIAEIEEAGERLGSVNYDENIATVLCATMAVIYNRPYEDFAEAVNNELKN